MSQKTKTKKGGRGRGRGQATPFCNGVVWPPSKCLGWPKPPLKSLGIAQSSPFSRPTGGCTTPMVYGSGQTTITTNFLFFFSVFFFLYFCFLTSFLIFFFVFLILYLTLFFFFPFLVFSLIFFKKFLFILYLTFFFFLVFQFSFLFFYTLAIGHFGEFRLLKATCDTRDLVFIRKDKKS